MRPARDPEPFDVNVRSYASENTQRGRPVGEAYGEAIQCGIPGSENGDTTIGKVKVSQELIEKHLFPAHDRHQLGIGKVTSQQGLTEGSGPEGIAEF